MSKIDISKLTDSDLEELKEQIKFEQTKRSGRTVLFFDSLTNRYFYSTYNKVLKACNKMSEMCMKNKNLNAFDYTLLIDECEYGINDESYFLRDFEWLYPDRPFEATLYPSSIDGKDVQVIDFMYQPVSIHEGVEEY